ncbi:MAG: hypothetical protein R3272_10255 [Candidatus Promineifilaceae bacterium]|nr:hypothetical protein [Candidatus Promineifilaceae bacterium]
MTGRNLRCRQTKRARDRQEAEAVDEQLKELTMHKLLAALTFLFGLVLMLAKVVVDSEPGALPILLVLLGAGWYFIIPALRGRGQGGRKSPHE